MCGIDCFISKLNQNKSDSIRNEFGSVQFQKRGLVRILLFTAHVIANITATVDDMTTSLISLTTTPSH